MRRFSKLPKQHQAELREAVLLLRFRCTRPTAKSAKYAAYARIAQALGITYNEVQHICRRALKPSAPVSFDKQVRQLGEEHVAFLLNERVLEQWSGKTMKERTVLFHRRFPDKRIAVTSLRRLYLKHTVRRKRVRHEKVMPPGLRAEYAGKCSELLAELEWAETEGRTVVFLDEINFTKLSLPRREWAARNSNLSVDQREVYQGYRSVIATMTAERGVGLCLIHTKAVAAEDFVAFLRRLRNKLGRRPVALFMDQLRVHKSRDVQPEYERLDITPIYNVGYSPELNPIEAVFSKVKAVFCRARLNNLVNKTGFNFERTITAAFKSIAVEHCAACVRKSRHLLERGAQPT